PTLFEIWVCVDGYWCDHTKNVCPGELRPEYVELEQQLLDVYTSAIQLCTPTSSLAELDRQIREGIAEAGYPGQPSHPVCPGGGGLPREEAAAADGTVLREHEGITVARLDRRIGGVGAEFDFDGQHSRPGDAVAVLVVDAEQEPGRRGLVSTVGASVNLVDRL